MVVRDNIRVESTTFVHRTNRILWLSLRPPYASLGAVRGQLNQWIPGIWDNRFRVKGFPWPIREGSVIRIRVARRAGEPRGVLLVGCWWVAGGLPVAGGPRGIVCIVVVLGGLASDPRG